LANDEDKINDIYPNLTRLTSALDSKTKRYLRESKRKLAQMVKEGPYFINFHKLTSTEIPVSTPETSTTDIAGLNTSSDTGLGTSDDVISVASSAEKNDNNSDASGSRQSSTTREGDEPWRDYEGDISSNNESSMSSIHARFSQRTREYVRQNGEVVYENVPYPIEEDANCYYNLPYRPNLLHLHQGDEPVNKHQRNNSALSGKPLRNNRHRREHGQGHAVRKPFARTTNVKDETNNGAVKDSNHIKELRELNAMKALYDQSANRLGSNEFTGTCKCSNPSFCKDLLLPKAMPTDGHMEVRKLAKGFKEERCLNAICETPGSSLIHIHDDSTANFLLQDDSHSSIIDDHTYILATDADMEFTDSSVLDLLNLCHYDRRVGGACGRTHPIGQKTGPLVWYQKFEYAKGRC